MHVSIALFVELIFVTHLICIYGGNFNRWCRDDEEYYDITIEVGSDPYVKVFRAHMVILNYRSPYLRRILSTNKRQMFEF
ncbi:BTB/POZ protein [Rhizophagus irregularis DAOM 181602=DAOM 197198]|nr:BTB/POZ protein [Rhizophagus irregularis DAOM 181602=DAOM 197198]